MTLADAQALLLWMKKRECCEKALLRSVKSLKSSVSATILALLSQLEDALFTQGEQMALKSAAIVNSEAGMLDLVKAYEHTDAQDSYQATLQQALNEQIELTTSHVTTMTSGITAYTTNYLS